MEVNTYHYINLEYMDMMSEGDDSMKKIMLEMLLEELPQEIKKMISLISENNWENLAALSHKLKSTLAFVGNSEMSKANSEIEKIAKESPAQVTLISLASLLDSLYPKVVAELEVELGKL